MIAEAWDKIKDVISDWKERAKEYIDQKIFDFVMKHLNLEETIIAAASKATTNRMHVTYFFLLLAYFVQKGESKVKSWFKKKDPLEEDYV
jgi:hypothetical protein